MKLRHNIADVRRSFAKLTKSQVPFATALALNDTAMEAKAAAEEGMQRDLDRPTPFTQRGLYLRRASKGRLKATLGYKDIQAGYMRFQVQGGERRPARRAILIPKGVGLNRYGNMPRRAVAGLLRRKDVFVARGGGSRKTRHMRPGIYKRVGLGASERIELMVAFASRARYGRRFDFRKNVLTRVRMVYRDHYRRRLVEALRSAK